MSSGSLKDLTKAIATSISAPTPPLPLPSSLVEILHQYLSKHPNSDDDYSQRVQDELLSIYNTQVANVSSRLAPFLAILHILKPAIQGSGRLLQWWEKLSPKVLQYLGSEKGLAEEARTTLLGVLVWEEDDEDTEDVKADKRANVQAVAESLVKTWISLSKVTLEGFDDKTLYTQNQVQLILLSFGRRRPKDLMSTINKFFVKKESRILALSLLCDFIRHQPPHLHQMLQTPLFDNLLKCLQVDTSTRVISLAMTALIMFLPHIPSSASAYLPALFNIYSRMLFWERERKAPDTITRDEGDELSEKQGNSWVKMAFLLESEDETVPELLHYFTFLYGLYPLNFMSYIRKPQKYLRHANFSGADNLDIEPSEIRQRSETFRQVHLLHPNFFMLTMESELTDTNRWRTSEAADVVAECMGLYNPGEESHTRRLRGPANDADPNSDIPEQPLPDVDHQSPFLSKHGSWRHTQSMSKSASPDELKTQIQRKASQTSQSVASIADSPLVRPSEKGTDSPTLHPQRIGSPLSEMLNNQQSSRDSIYRSLTNDSSGSLALSNANNNEHPVDNHIANLSRDTIPRSPSLRAFSATEPRRILYLQREIQLLRNDLNFEQYLKAQHLSHIGRLRRKQIREARVEAETQNLVNSTRQLKSKLEEAKRINLQMRKESEKSRTLSRKWENDLSSKIRVLREDSKMWSSEKDELKRDLKSAKENCDQLRQLVVLSESRELAAAQKFESVESSLDELERLRVEVDKLTTSVRTYEAGEGFAVKAHENEQAAIREVTVLQMQLKARDRELQLAQQAFEKELYAARNWDKENQIVVEGGGKPALLVQDVIDSALASSKNRILELQKAHKNLQRKHTALQNQYITAKEQLEHHPDVDTPLLSSSSHAPRQMFGHAEGYSPSPAARGLTKRAQTVADAVTWASHPPPTAPPTSPLPARPLRSDTTKRFASPAGGRSPISGAANHYMGTEPFSGSMTSSDSGKGKERESVDDESFDTPGKPKVKPRSDVRIYGRGGVQNIGKPQRDKGKDGKEGEGKKEKKGVGLRGIRGSL